jgi:uncharacterized membrane protein
MQRKAKERVCQICGSTVRETLRPGVLVRPAVADLIRADKGAWTEEGWICLTDLQEYRHRYVQGMLRDERGELSALDREVVESLRQHEVLTRNPDDELQAAQTRGQRVADHIAAFGGSWRFIGIFTGVMMLWILGNSLVALYRPWDPYPFILLNLALSCLAALQAPVIMMSQGRQESRDRLHAQRDYQVNLKAELEIRHLHQKIDHLLSHQWERLVEIQEIQMELINELRGKD